MAEYRSDNWTLEIHESRLGAFLAQRSTIIVSISDGLTRKSMLIPADALRAMVHSLGLDTMPQQET